ncbi:hypothetical protein KY345_04260 [Candidatus Woesearchaeota archaeon]|nr:hypothetical protein [Candidatus Woesearchaeota archaeon]
MAEEQIKDEELQAEQKFSVEKEISAVIDSLRDSREDVLKLISICKQFRESLEKSTKEQLFAWDKLVRDYEFFEEDVDVNGERVKRITKALVEQAKSAGIDKEKLKEFKSKESWSFDW